MNNRSRNRTGGPVIQTDARLKELFDLMVSVPGIGPVIATELLIATARAAPQ